MNRPLPRRPLVIPVVFALAMLPAMGVQAQQINFSKDVRPILSNACFHCHGPDADERQAELRLDQEEGLFSDRGGYVTVKPRDTEHSELIRRILSSDPDEMMPPPDSNKALSEDQKKILSQWVRQGAEWQQHWSFIPPQAGSPPATRNGSWPKNAIDSYLLARMEEAGLQPAPQADLYTLIRRLYLDLTGLPPSPPETERWVTRLQSAGSPSASDADVNINETEYQNLITHLLDSPHYGERWARRWLDLARYADTNGYEKDRERSIWPYRDWVVNAINSGMPFDRFTIEQLAGDMLPGATVDQKIATGFHRNTMLNEEGGIDPLEFRYHAMTDRVSTTGTTWLGLTLGCCQCHTHKYDPVSHDEYFQIMAYLNNADEPVLELPDWEIDAQWKRNRQKAADLLMQLPQKWPLPPGRPVAVKQTGIKMDGAQKTVIRKDGYTVINGPNPERATSVTELEVADRRFDQLRLFVTAPAKLKGPGRTAHGNFVLSEIVVEVVNPDDPHIATRIPIESGTASVEQSGFEVAKAFDGNDSTGWGISGPQGVPRSAEATFSLARKLTDFPATGPIRLRVTLKQLYGSQHTIAAFRFEAQQKTAAEDRETLRQTALTRAFQKWRESEQPNAVTWSRLRPVSATSNLPILTIQEDHSIFASGDTAKRDDYYITLAASEKPVTSLRLEALPDERLPERGPGSTYYEGTRGDFFLTEIRASSADAKFPFASASQTYAKNRFGNNPATAALAIDGDIQTGWSVHDRQGERHIAVFNFKEPVPPGTPLTIHMSFGRHFASSLGRFRFSATDSTTRPLARNYGPEAAAALQKKNSADQLQGADFDAFLMNAPELREHTNQIRSLQKRPKRTTTLVMAERPEHHPRPTYRHHRGEYLQPKNEVAPGLPDALAGNTGRHPRNRLEFAKWIVSRQNPLTARVVVNRHWAAIFGTGLVKTLDDFGLQGESPSHPALLDWLAVTLVSDDQWSIKKLHRRIVSSAAYRQSSTVNPKALNVDPGNRLLSYSPRFRLDAEIVRDQLLAAAGVLNRTRGGPPVRPLQPAGITEFAYGSPKWNASSGTERYRRSLYTFTKRTAPFAMYATFDGPSGEACIARRTRSNSPLQALTLLNDVMLMDLARHAGGAAASEDTQHGQSQAITTLFRSVLVRPPTESERTALLKFLEAQQKNFSANSEHARQLLNLESAAEEPEVAKQAAWVAVARAVYSLDEALTRN